MGFSPAHDSLKPKASPVVPDKNIVKEKAAPAKHEHKEDVKLVEHKHSLPAKK